MTTTDPSLERDISISALGTIAQYAIGAIGGVLVARLLAPDSRGLLALIVVAGTMVAILLAAGVPYWTVPKVAREGVSSAVLTVTRTQLAIAMAITSTVGFVLLLSTTWAASLTLLGVSLTAALVGGSLLIAIPTGLRNLTAVAIGTAGGSAVYAAGLAVLLILDLSSLDLALAVTVLAELWVGAVGWLSYRRRVLVSELRVDVEACRQAVKIGWPAAIGDLVTYSTSRADLFLIASLLTLRDAGIYAVALTVAEMPVLLATATARVALAHVAASDSESSVAPMSRRLVVVMLTVCTVVLIIAPFVLPWLVGTEYGRATVVLPIVMGGRVLLGLWKVAAADLSTQGRNRVRAVSAAAGLAATVTIDIALVPTIGLVGAAIGSLAGYGVSYALVALTWSRVHRRPVTQLFVVRPDDVRQTIRSVRSVGRRAPTR